MIYRETEIAKLAGEIVDQMSGENAADIEIRIAALRAAAEIFQQALTTRAMAVSMRNILYPDKR